MLKTAEQHLDSLRDGREIYLGGEPIDDVTTHPAFRNGAKHMAALYDITSDSANTARFTYEEDGDRHNLIFKRPRSSHDLAARRAIHQAWGDATHGLMGRSPDHVAGFITGMACQPDVFDLHDQGFGKNIVDYWTFIRANDHFLAYAVVPPAGAKGQEAVVVQQGKGFAPEATETSGVRVLTEDDSGLVVRGFKILATGAPYANEVLVGNVLPLAPGDEPFAITFALPVATPGLKLLSRKSYEQHAMSLLDDPLGSRLDETDAVLFFDDVHVPWNRVFAHNHLDTARAIFYDTPAHTLGNAQAHIRLLSKLRTILGITVKVTEANGIFAIPAVRDKLAELAVRVAMVEGLVLGQEAIPEMWPSGYVSQNRQTMYATMSWTCEYFPEFLGVVRELLGSSPFQLPGDASVFDNQQTASMFSEFTTIGEDESRERYKLLKLAWDFVGSEFANRHLQYEMFYAGPQHVTRGRAGHFFDWDVAKAAAEDCLASLEMTDGGAAQRPEKSDNRPKASSSRARR